MVLATHGSTRSEGRQTIRISMSTSRDSEHARVAEVLDVFSGELASTSIEVGHDRSGIDEPRDQRRQFRFLMRWRNGSLEDGIDRRPLRCPALAERGRPERAVSRIWRTTSETVVLWRSARCFSASNNASSVRTVSVLLIGRLYYIVRHRANRSDAVVLNPGNL